MFKQSIQAVIDDGLSQIERLRLQAVALADASALEVESCKSKIAGLVSLAKAVPENALDKYAHLFVGEFKQHQSNLRVDIALNKNGEYVRMTGIMGGEALREGKYRAIVLLERVGDVG